MAQLTPMMQQYFDMKEQYPDCLLFFRLGDFYEMFGQDAKTAAAALGLTLTTRDRGVADVEARTPMCGVPHHSVVGYLARLIKQGHKVALCEQMEDPALAKGLVSREVVRVITPGTVLETDLLEEGRNNYIAAVHWLEGSIGLVFADISTGIAHATQLDKASGVAQELARFAPIEVICDMQVADVAALSGCRLSPIEAVEFQGAFDSIVNTFGDKTAALVAQQPAAQGAVVAMLRYLRNTQKQNIILGSLMLYHQQAYVGIDANAKRNLELVGGMHTGSKQESLLGVLDATRTPMGARLLRADIEMPLRDAVKIDNRLSAVEVFTKESMRLSELRRLLKGFPDMERTIGRVVYGQTNPREVRAMATACLVLPDIREILESVEVSLVQELYARIDPLEDLTSLLLSALEDTPAISQREGDIIRAGYHPEVDRLRSIKQNALGLVAGMEAAEREKTGIKNLKIGYNRVFGYYIEISKSNVSSAPSHYVRKQTLAGGERYITNELKDMESTLLSAQDKLNTLEYELFSDLLHQLIENLRRFQSCGRALARLDVILSLAHVAVKQRYTRPVVDLSDTLEIVEGRHPVVECLRKDSVFVPNDVQLDSQAPVVILTGPNMAGKSTYMRQVALIAIMAHIGSFVPAKRAHVGVLDRVFTRIGASDDLSGGRSTFMVEMTEVAEILQEATAKSLLILDEIGRGTSTFDGMAVARAVLERVADRKKLGAKTLFATHYHELTTLEDTLVGVRNFNVAVKKRGNDIVFLRKIVPGGADDSYGVEVARLAGLPEEVIKRARAFLTELEAGAHVTIKRDATQETQVSMDSYKSDELRQQLLKLDVNTLSPIEALQVLFRLQQDAR